MEIEIFNPKDLAHWRSWLEENHMTKKAVWLVFYTKASGKNVISWSEAVDQALCFGWIDSKKIKIDKEISHQYFSKRKAKSTWSKINKDKIDRLMAEGLMAPAGLEIIEIAKQNGSWNLLDEVEKLIVPEDLDQALKANPGAEEYFLNLSKSTRKFMLTWILFAKSPETRQKRINEIAELAAKGQKPKQF